MSSHAPQAQPGPPVSHAARPAARPTAGRTLVGAVALLAVAALLGCSSGPSDEAVSSAKPRAVEPQTTPPAEEKAAPEADAAPEFPMPAAAGDPGQSLADACALLYSGSEIHQTRASSLNIKDQEELARELPLIVADAQAEFVRVGHPQAAPIATEYSKQVALMSQAMLGGEYAVTAIAAAGADVQAVVNDALALCSNG